MSTDNPTSAPGAPPAPAVMGPFNPRTYTPAPQPVPAPGTRSDFLKALPDYVLDGFDLTGKVYDDRLRFAFGQWDIEAGDDEDVRCLASLHSRAVDEYRAMAEALASIRNDDDPTLNSAGRLAIAGRTLEPRLVALAETAERELARASARIEAEEAALTTTAKVTDPAQAVLHDSIRRHIKENGLQPGRVKEGGGYQTGLQGTDDETLLAIVSAPAYLSGLDAETYEKCRQALAERMAPERVKKLTKLRKGKDLAIKALSELDRRSRKFVDFDKARELSARGTGGR